MMDKNTYQVFEGYNKRTDIYPTKGANPSLLNSDKGGATYGSLVNKLHLIKVFGLDPDETKAYVGDNKGMFTPKTFSDLCKMEQGAVQYDAEDFLYCKNLGFPINRMITLRRFPYPCTDNIYDVEVQREPDIARMVTYYDQTTNKLEELLGFSYRMKWKELTSEMEQANMQGDQSGQSGYMKKVGSLFDANLAGNVASGENALNYDPKNDQNKVYGPVDSIINTHIRDVGLEFEKEIEILFEYELRSISGRTPEFAMKDILSNVLCCTYNNGKFWGGSRFWIGERPSNFFQKLSFMNSRDADDFMFGAFSQLKSGLSAFNGDKKGTAIAALKTAMKNGFALALGKLLDKVGRPSIVMMNSLLQNEPTGYWHLMIGSPDNPILCIGNLIVTDTEVSFPTDSLSYGDFPTKMQFRVKMKPAMSKDAAGIEMMFNMGRQRIYYTPKTIEVSKNKNVLSKQTRSFFGFENVSVDSMINQTFDFLAEKTPVVIKNVVSSEKSTPSPTPSTTNDDSKSASSGQRSELEANSEA